MSYCLWLSQRKNSGPCINTSTGCLPPFHSVSFNTSSPYHCAAEGHPIMTESHHQLYMPQQMDGVGRMWQGHWAVSTNNYIYIQWPRQTQKKATSGLALGEMLPGLQIGSWQAPILLNEEIWRQENGDAVVAGSFTEDQAATAPSARRSPAPRPIPSKRLMNCLKQPLCFAKINGGAVTKHKIISSEMHHVSDAFRFSGWLICQCGHKKFFWKCFCIRDVPESKFHFWKRNYVYN